MRWISDSPFWHVFLPKPYRRSLIWAQVFPPSDCQRIPLRGNSLLFLPSPPTISIAYSYNFNVFGQKLIRQKQIKLKLFHTTLNFHILLLISCCRQESTQFRYQTSLFYINQTLRLVSVLKNFVQISTKSRAVQLFWVQFELRSETCLKQLKRLFLNSQKSHKNLKKMSLKLKAKHLIIKMRKQVFLLSMIITVWVDLIQQQNQVYLNLQLIIVVGAMGGCICPTVRPIHREAFVDQERMCEIDLAKSALADMVLVEITARNPKTGKNYSGTGLLICQKFVLTAAHVVYSKEHEIYYEDIQLSFYIAGRLKQMRAKKPTILKEKDFIRAPVGQRSCRFDYAVIEMEEERKEPKAGLIYQQKMLGLSDEFMKKVGEVQNQNDKIMVLGFGAICQASDRFQYKPQLQIKTLKISTGSFSRACNLLKYKLNTTDGMSGGAILQFSQKNIRLISIHIAANTHNDNRHKIISPDEYNIGLSIDQFQEDIKQLLNKTSQNIFALPELEKQIETKRIIQNIESLMSNIEVSPYKMRIIKRIIEDNIKQEQLKNIEERQTASGMTRYPSLNIFSNSGQYSAGTLGSNTGPIIKPKNQDTEIHPPDSSNGLCNRNKTGQKRVESIEASQESPDGLSLNIIQANSVEGCSLKIEGRNQIEEGVQWNTEVGQQQRLHENQHRQRLPGTELKQKRCPCEIY